MSKQNTAKETLDQMVETNKNMEHNTAMKENTYNLDTKQLMTNKKADLVAMNLQNKAEIEELRAMIADLKATATKEDEVVATKPTKKAEKATATKTTKKAKKTTKKSKKATGTKKTKLTDDQKKEAREAQILAVAGYCSCPDCIATNKFCTGLGTKWLAKDGKLARDLWFEKHMKDVSGKLDRQVKAGEISKATATKQRKLHVLVAGKSS